MSMPFSIPAPQGQCPLCAQPAKAPHQPFCSARCQMLDLGNWFNEAYAAPAEDAESLPQHESEGFEDE